jgi:hypothetical protein
MATIKFNVGENLAILTSIEFGSIPWSLLFMGEQTYVETNWSLLCLVTSTGNFSFMSSN